MESNEEGTRVGEVLEDEEFIEEEEESEEGENGEKKETEVSESWKERWEKG